MIYADQTYNEALVAIFNHTKAVVGTLEQQNQLVMVPKFKTAIESDQKIQLMGRSFCVNEKGSRAFLYIGSERLLDTFVIPNIGTDFNLYFCNEKNLEQTAKIAVEPVSIRQTNKVLMQRYQSLAQVSEA